MKRRTFLRVLGLTALAPAAGAKLIEFATKKKPAGPVYDTRWTEEWLNRDIQTETWWNNTTEPSALTQEDIRKAMEKLYRECCEGVQEPREMIVFTDEDSYWAIRDEWTKIKI